MHSIFQTFIDGLMEGVDELAGHFITDWPLVSTVARQGHSNAQRILTACRTLETGI
jgi:hypothetical protein